MTKTFTAEELEAIGEDEFYDMANGNAVSMTATDVQAEYLRDIYAGWVETLDPDIKEAFEDADREKDIFDVYSTLRINEADFDLPNGALTI